VVRARGPNTPIGAAHFHRAFLKLHRPELAPDTLPLRRVQQYVHQTLQGLVREGRASAIEEDFEVEPGCIPLPYRERLFD